LWEQLNSHGFSDFKLVSLKVVQHVFRVDGVVQRASGVVGAIETRFAKGVGRIERPYIERE